MTIQYSMIKSRGFIIFKQSPFCSQLAGNWSLSRATNVLGGRSIRAVLEAARAVDQRFGAAWLMAINWWEFYGREVRRNGRRITGVSEKWSDNIVCR